MLRPALLLLLSLLFPSLHSLELAISVDIPSIVEVKNAQSVGLHDCSEASSGWVKVSTFQIDSNSPTGFTVSAQFQNGYGWALNGTGSTNGVDYNPFRKARLHSNDNSNYHGNNPLNHIFPLKWNTVNGNVKSFSSGYQTEVMNDWTVDVYVKWRRSSSLTPGIYSQVLTVTIAPSS